MHKLAGGICFRSFSLTFGVLCLRHKQKSNLFQFSSWNFISLICSNCFKMCKTVNPNAGNQNTIFSTKHGLSNPTNNQLHLWSDYSGISSSGSNGLDLHAIAQWNRLLPSCVIYWVFIQPVWQLYCLKNSKKGRCCEIPPCRGSLSCSPPSRLHQSQWWECGSHSSHSSSPQRQQWAI